MQRREWLRVGLLAFGVFLLALVPRLLGLDVFLTADEPKAWFGRAIQFLDALARADWAATFDTPAPGVTTMWAGALGLLLEYVRQGLPGGSLTAFLASVPFDPLDPSILPLIRLPIVLMAAAAAPLTYVWGRPLWGHKAAVLAALLLAFDPFLLALSRVLGHDALVAVFMWLSLLAFLRAANQLLISPGPRGAAGADNLQSPHTFDRRYIIVSGALGGLAFLTKYPSLFLGMFVAVTMLLLHVGGRQPWQTKLRAWVVDVALWSLAAGLVFVLLWPAMWVDPIGRVTSIVNDALRASGSPHPKGSFYLGQPVPDPGLSFYVLVTLFRTTPLLWLGWLLAGATYLAWRPRWTHGRSALILLAFALLYGLLVTVGGKKQDRYILPAFPALAVLAALGYAQISNIKSQITNHSGSRGAAGTGKSRMLSVGFLAGVIALQVALVLPHYPYYLTYYNPLMGGGPAAARMLNVGWGEGLDQAARWLNSLPGAENSSVVAWYSTTFEPFFHGNAIYKIDEEKISRSSKPGLAADYVVLYVNQVQRELPSAGALQFFRSKAPVHTVTLHGIDYAWIYPSVKMQHVIAGEARLVGQAELLGYDLTDEAGQPATAASPAGVLRLALYWEWQGNAEGEPIRASLVDDGGKTRGWGNWLQTVAPLPRSEWQAGMVVRDDFGLAIFEDTPPGEYRLAVWIERPATRETVGVFPLEGEVKIRVVPRGAK